MYTRNPNMPLFRSESPTSDTEYESFSTPQTSTGTHTVWQHFGKNYTHDGTAISSFYAQRQENNVVLSTEIPCQRSTNPHCNGQCYSVVNTKCTRSDSYYCTVPGCPEQGLV